MNNEVAIFQQEIEAQKSQLQSILPEHLPVERFIRASIVAVQTNPGVLNADRQSLFNALTRCAGDGLVPDNREAALVEFNTNIGNKQAPNWIKKIQYMPMVDGVLKRARQSGEVAVITARAVHENDEFNYWVDENGEHLKHRPSFESDRGAIKLVYAMAKMKSGDVIVEPMTLADVNKVKAASKTSGSGPWVDWFERMALKSALHRLARRLPNSSEIMEMLSNDNWMYDFNNERKQQALPSSRNAEPESNTVSKAQIDEINKALKFAGVSELDFCKKLRIGSMEELEKARFQASLDFLNRYIDSQQAIEHQGVEQ